MYRARYTFYNVLLNSIKLMEYLTSHYTTFRKTHYRKITLLEYITKKVKLLEYIVRPDLTFSICHHGVRAPLIDSLFQTSL
jgi:predicted nucleotidyltransferase